MSSHAQICLQGACKQLRKVTVDDDDMRANTKTTRKSKLSIWASYEVVNL